MKTLGVLRPVPGPSLASLDEQVRFAIAHKRLIQLDYEGHRRLAEPHDYGLPNGVTKTFVYQLSKAGGLPKDARVWRMFDTSKISECAVQERGFRGTRARSDQRHH